MDIATTIMSMILGFVIGEVVYWLIIRRLIDWIMQRPFTFKTRKNQKLVVAVFNDRVMIRKFKVRHPFVTMNGRMYKLRDEDSIEVYMDDSLKPF